MNYYISFGMYALFIFIVNRGLIKLKLMLFYYQMYSNLAFKLIKISKTIIRNLKKKYRQA